MKNKITAFDILNYVFFIVVAFCSIYPIFLIVVNAFASEADIQQYGFSIWPKSVTLEAFKFIFQTPKQLIYGLRATLVEAFGKSFLNIFINAMLGYALTRKEFIFKKFFEKLLVFFMFISAGLIPTYMIYTQIYHLDDTWFIYLAPAVAPMTVFMFRTFFNQVPKSLIESAELDGATHMQVLTKITMPLSMAFIATQLFLSMSGYWKDYTTTLYYITDPKMYNLEYYIQLLAKDASFMVQAAEAAGKSASSIPVETMKFATVLLSMIPIMIIFPRFQKHFTKGMIVGSVKG